MPQRTIPTIRQFHNGVRAYVQLDDGSPWNRSSSKDAYPHSSPVIYAAFMRFKADKDVMNALVNLWGNGDAEGAAGYNSLRIISGDITLG